LTCATQPGAAIDFISQHYGQREVAAFQACAVPAMRADYIRLCMIDVFGGVYVDADNQSLVPLKDMIDRVRYSLLFTYTGMLNNGFKLFREPAIFNAI
jgi:mannosyltransferase OCH1-like enzyme